MPWLIAIRGLMSVGMGAEYVMCYGMIAELMPAATRGRYLGILGVFAGAGVAITALISVVVVPMLGWRTMFAIGGVGTLFVWWMRRSMPESPRWLEAVGRQDEAEAILRRIEADLPPRAVAPSQPSATKFEGAAHDAAAKRVTIAILFSRSVIRFTLLAATLNVVALSGLYSIAGWMPTFFVSQGMDISKSLWLNAAIMAGSIAGPLPYALLATRVTRRQAMALAGIACAVLAALFPFMSASVAIALCGFCLVATVNSFLNLSLGTTPEFFPTEYRFRGAGVAQTVGRIGLILSPFVVLWLFRSFGVAGVLGVVAVMYLVVTLLLLGQSRLANRSAVWA
jgi:putative MFS transporter